MRLIGTPNPLYRHLLLHSPKLVLDCFNQILGQSLAFYLHLMYFLAQRVARSLKLLCLRFEDSVERLRFFLYVLIERLQTVVNIGKLALVRGLGRLYLLR